MTNKVRIGVIGLGIMGEQYVRIYRSHPWAEVVAICARGEGRRNEIGEKYAVEHRYQSCDAMLEDKNIDAVCVATPDDVHYDPTKKALLAGKHVLVEKPMTTSLDEADDLLETVKRTGLKLQVAYNHRWLSPYYQGFLAIQRGDIGKPLLGYARKNDTIYVATEYIPWAAQTTPAYFLSSHDLDLMRWFFQSEPVEAHAYGVKEVLVGRGIDTYDLIQAQMKFASGAVATFEAGWIYPNTFPTMVDSFVEVVGSSGHLHFDRKRESLEMSTPKAFTYPKAFLSAEVFGKLRGAFPACLDDFIDCIVNDAEPGVTAYDGRQVTAALEAIHESLSTSKTVAVRQPES